MKDLITIEIAKAIVSKDYETLHAFTDVDARLEHLGFNGDVVVDDETLLVNFRREFPPHLKLVE